MKTIRIVLAIWGLICILSVGYGALRYPLIKMSTSMALSGIERNILQTESLSLEEKESLEMFKAVINGNAAGLKSSAQDRQILLSIIGLVTSFLCLGLAVGLPRITKLST